MHHVIDSFEPFYPLMRNGGGRRPDGTMRSWSVSDGTTLATPIDVNDPRLPDLSELGICGIGNIKDILASGTTRRQVFMDLLQE